MLAFLRPRLPPVPSFAFTLIRRPAVGRCSIIESFLFCVAREASAQRVVHFRMVGASESPARAKKATPLHRERLRSCGVRASVNPAHAIDVIASMHLPLARLPLR